MKKLIIISLIAGSLIAAPTISNAATKAPKPQITGGASAREGTAEHEAGEGNAVEKSEKKVKKKVIKKKK